MNTASLRDRFEQLNPGRFFLDPQDLPSLEAWLKDQGWIAPDQHVQSAIRAGEGNMNRTLRIVTDSGSFILKQARPWVEKYPSIDAPDERAVVEAGFYSEVADDPLVSSQMPRLIAHSYQSRILMLEDLTPASDFTSIYENGEIAAAELLGLATWLRALHTNFRDDRLARQFANTAMRALNHVHIFDLPLRRDNGWGFDASAGMLWSDAAYCRRVRELGQLYLGDGACLIHGDFFPGSWMRVQSGVRIIDPEFCFWGMPEFDLGVLFAHCLLAHLPAKTIELIRLVYPLASAPLSQAFAGVEIMRRLIGVAQLPLPYGLPEKTRLLERSRTMVLAL